ncbi:MAG TPA: DUF2066 domain-containing protein [Stellaceae bacterium]|nr:DUF2066 domain-containing protein [Stellaceae bacterium]
MTIGRGILLGLVLASAALVAPGRAAAPPDVFTVAAVPVDATAANAAAARDEARADGERHAYEILLDRLTLASDRARLPAANESRLNNLLAGYEVANERVSGVRYLANYTYHFRPDAVRQLLRQANIPFAETPSRPVVVLAIWQGDSGPALWEDPNPWRDAWGQHPPQWGLVPFVIPYGELEDVQAIDGAAAVAGDAAHLQAIAQRYGGADLLVTQAKLTASPAPASLAVTTTRYDPTGAMPPQSWNKTYVAAADESEADLLAAAVAGTAARVEDAWKTANIIDFGHTASITVRVPLDGIQSWIAIRNRLAGIPAIRRTELVSLDQAQARLTLDYYGGPDQLRQALEQRNLELSGTDPDWVLAQHDAAAQP